MIERAIWERDFMSHTGRIATWSKGVIIRECKTGLYVIGELSSQTYGGSLTMVAI